MDYTPAFKQLVEGLLQDGYLILVGGKPVLTAKFEKELGYKSQEVAMTPIQKEIVKSENVMNSGDVMKKITDPKLAWNTFILDAEIPHRVKSTDGSTYTIRQYSQSIARKLLKIIQDPKVDYWKLVESTKNYYKTTSYKALLSNYISKDIWMNEYSEWKGTGKTVTLGDGGNRWESE